MSDSSSSGVVLVVAGAAALLASLDSALNIAFPDVTAHFDIDVAAIRWLVISYVLTYAVLLLLAGRVADRLGHVRMLVGGLVVSTAAFVATGFAPTYELLLSARVMQGIGAAMILGAAPALVTLTIAADRRGRALGLFHMCASVGLAIGPLVGGLLVSSFGWRSVFLFRVPIAFVVLALAWTFVSSGGTVAAPLGTVPGEMAGDELGEVVAILRKPRLVVANLLNLFSNAALFAIWLLVPYYAINVLDIGAALGGLMLTVAPAATALSAPPAGWLADRVGGFSLSAAGLALQATALGILSRLDETTAVFIPMVALALVGVGISVFTVPNMRDVMGAIGANHQGVAGSAVQTMRTVGIVVGVLVAGAWFENERAATASRLGVDGDGPISFFVPAFQNTLTLAAAVSLTLVVVSVVMLGIDGQLRGSIRSASSATSAGKSGPAARVTR